MHKSAFEFIQRCASSINEPEKKRVLEVGSYDVNGSVRPLFSGFKDYLGLDMRHGPGVDMVANAEDVDLLFGKESHDVIVCAEMLEHCRLWQRCVHGMKRVLKKQGVLILTTRSPKFPIHDFPSDYWRFNAEILGKAFADLFLLYLCDDQESPGIFAFFGKTDNWKEEDDPVHTTYAIDAVADCRMRKLAGERETPIRDRN
jgi:SAM-dependent methyltransferase